MMHTLRHSGFTMVELIMVLLLLGIAAAIVLPRFGGGQVEARGFHDETLALLRYAQKSAIAQRRTVCVAFGANPSSVTLTMTAAAGVAACPANPMTGPDGNMPARIVARQGVAYVALPVGFQFDGLGQPSAGQVIQVGSDGVPLGPQITVQAVTGHVHD